MSRESMRCLWIIILALAISCSSESESTPDTAGPNDALTTSPDAGDAEDAGAGDSTPIPADVPTFKCGDTRCETQQVCIINSDCSPNCAPAPEGTPEGTCPEGYLDNCFEPGFCREICGSPNLYSCQDIPAQCGSELTCACFPDDICERDGGVFPSCGTVEDGDTILCPTISN